MLGSPISDATVILQSSSGDEIVIQTTDANGDFQVDSLTGGVYRFNVGAAGFTSISQLVEVSNGIQTTFELEAEGTLSGSVTDASEGVVALYQDGQVVRWASVDPDGKYTVEKLAGGEYLVTVLHESQLYPIRTLSVGAGTTNIEDFSALGGSVSGIATDENGQVIADASIVATSVDSINQLPVSRSVRTASDGSFIFVGVHTANTTLTLIGDEIAQRSIAVTTTTGLDVVQDIAEQTNVSYDGLVRNDSGAGINNATVYLLNTSHPNAPAIEAPTSANGDWNVQKIVPGEYQLIVVSAGYASHSEVVVISSNLPAKEIVLTTVGNTVSGTITMEGIPVANALVVVFLDGIAVAEVTSNAAGEYELAPITPGQYEIVVQASNANVHEEVVNVSGDIVNDVVLTNCNACYVPLPQSTSPSPQDSTPQCNGQPCTGAQLDEAALQERFDRKADLDSEYNRVTSIPWESIPSIPDGPKDPDCFCNSASLKTRAEFLKSRRPALIAVSLSRRLDKVERLALDAALRGSANLMAGNANLSLLLASGKADEWAALAAALAASKYAGPAAAFWISVLGFLVTEYYDELSNADGFLNAYSGYIQWIEHNKNQFNKSIEKFRKDVEEYKEALEDYERDRKAELAECNIPTSIPSKSETVKKGETSAVDLIPTKIRIALEQLTLNGVSWYVEETDNPSGSGVSINSGGVAVIGDGDCGAFTISYRVVIECDDSGVFGFLKDKKFANGTFTLNRTKIEIPVTVNCGEDPPEDTDCFKYIVSYSGDCGSFDPNDIIGPAGRGAEHWVQAQGSYDYTIRFENDPEEATAPAATVRITQILDDDLDFSTFRLGQFGFGDTVVTGAQGLSTFEQRLDRTEDLGIFIDISAGIDVSTGEIFFQFTSIDPDTGEVPFSPLVGFLPPNVDGSEGQGFVSYSIKAKSDVQSGDVIDATADIVFDQNEAIETPAIFNTIDRDGPLSQVSALGAESFPGFNVQWVGQDDANGSGVRSFDIYVSVDGGPFQLWLDDTMESKAPYVAAVPGSTYAFYSIATDLVGHRESAPISADAMTMAIEPETTTIVSVTVIQTPQLAITIEFADPMAIQSMIADGSIRSAMDVVNYSSGPIDLTDWQFSYDAASNSLSLTTSNVVPKGTYEVQLDGDQFVTSGGVVLKGGQSGLTFHIPGFEDPTLVQAGGSDLMLPADSSPIFVDWNSDGLTDLVVGERTGSNEGKIRVYLNGGSNSLPSFNDYFYARTPSADVVVPGANDMGLSLQYFDWNGDDENDLVLGLADGRVQLWTNVNTGQNPVFDLPEYVQFGPSGSKVDLDVGSRASVDVADWNNDGLFDLIVAGDDGRIRVFLNEGSTQQADFQTSFNVRLGAGTLVVPGGRTSVDVTDINDDGRKDIVAGNLDGQLFVYLNDSWDSLPMFNDRYPLNANGLPIDLDGNARTRPFVADFNDDGLADLVVGAADGKVRVFTGDFGVSYPPNVVAVAGGTYSHVFTITTDPVINTQIINGDFEADGDYSGLQFASEVPGWNAFPDVNGDRIMDVISRPIGNFINLDARAGHFDRIYQDLQTEAGKTYVIRFDLFGSGTGMDRSDEVRVLWDGQIVGTFRGIQRWQSVALEVVGTGDLSTRLEFRETFSQVGGDGNGPFLDNVSITSVTNQPFANGGFEEGDRTPGMALTHISDITDWYTDGPPNQRFATIREYGNPGLNGNYYWNLDSTYRYDRLIHGVETEVGKAYILMFDMRTPLDSIEMTNEVRIRWNNQWVATAVPNQIFQTFSVTLDGNRDGTSWIDFREAYIDGMPKGDGLGPWIDNIRIYEIDDSSPMPLPLPSYMTELPSSPGAFEGATEFVELREGFSNVHQPSDGNTTGFDLSKFVEGGSWDNRYFGLMPEEQIVSVKELDGVLTGRLGDSVRDQLFADDSVTDDVLADVWANGIDEFKTTHPEFDFEFQFLE